MSPATLSPPGLHRTPPHPPPGLHLPSPAPPLKPHLCLLNHLAFLFGRHLPVLLVSFSHLQPPWLRSLWGPKEKYHDISWYRRNHAKYRALKHWEWVLWQQGWQLWELCRVHCAKDKGVSTEWKEYLKDYFSKSVRSHMSIAGRGGLTDQEIFSSMLCSSGTTTLRSCTNKRHLKWPFFLGWIPSGRVGETLAGGREADGGWGGDTTEGRSLLTPLIHFSLLCVSLSLPLSLTHNSKIKAPWGNSYCNVCDEAYQLITS